MDAAGLASVGGSRDESAAGRYCGCSFLLLWQALDCLFSFEFVSMVIVVYCLWEVCMRLFALVFLFAMGCGGSGSGVVERISPTGEVQVLEAGSPMALEFVSRQPDDSGAPVVEGMLTSCSSGDGKKDCFCGSDGCCRDEHSCSCC